MDFEVDGGPGMPNANPQEVSSSTAVTGRGRHRAAPPMRRGGWALAAVGLLGLAVTVAMVSDSGSQFAFGSNDPTTIPTSGPATFPTSQQAALPTFDNQAFTAIRGTEGF